jgi:hypothetical protein
VRNAPARVEMWGRREGVKPACRAKAVSSRGLSFDVEELDTICIVHNNQIDSPDTPYCSLAPAEILHLLEGIFNFL